MNMKKITAIAAAVVMAAGIVTGVPTSTENVPPFAIIAEAADNKLAAPKNIKAAAGDGKVTLTWDKVKGADAYRVYLYNTDTKKYEQYKLVKSAKATVTDLENGKTYKFKVAAAVKNGKSYKTGTASAAVSASPKTAKKTQKETKPKMKEVKLTANEIVGSWVYYDFWDSKKYTSGTSYDPNKLQSDSDGWITNIQFLTEKEAMVVYNLEDGKYGEIANVKSNTFSEYSGCLQRYKVYSYGEDKFLFVQFINGDGENTYIFKYAPIAKKSAVTDISKLDGRWTATDFCSYDLKYRDSYNPLYPLRSAENLWLNGATVKDGKISILTKDGYYYAEDEKIGSDKIGDSKYYVYDINGTLYMYYQFINGDGDKQFYVFKKN